MHTRPVRVSVPTGISRQAPVSPSANAFTGRPGGKIVPCLVNQKISGMIAIPTVDSVLLSYRP